MPKRHVAGHWLHYRLWGALSGQLTPIVMLHHGFGHVDGWGGFPARLHAATGRAVLAYSRRDCGRSEASDGDRPRDFLEYEANEVLPAVLSSFGLRRACLYGHSDGGSIALIAASRHPELFEAVIVEAPHVFAEPLTIEGVRTMAHRFETDARFRRNALQGHEHGARPVQLWRDFWLHPQMTEWTIAVAAASLRMPLLLLQGDRDPFGTPAHVWIAAERNPRAEINLLTGVGHSPHQTEAGLPGMIRNFLKCADR